ncbi:MAG: putative peptidoglycan binding domain protein [Candidatus Kaiserbacteria bacterium]|nr:putative peptidoglycan binding domain protein [Candidatus Kaiserbacteria bacterium]
MRTVSALLFLALMLLPVSAFAAGPARMQCFLTSASDPSTKTPKEFTGNAAAQIKSFLDNIEQCPTACYYETITVNIADQKVNISVQAQNKCGDQPTKQKADQLKLGCNNGQTQPTVIVKRTGLVTKTEAPKSRCDTTNSVSSKVGAALAQTAKDAVLQGLAQKAATDVDINTPIGKEQTAGVLKAFGVNDAEANDLVAKKPEEAKALLQALASGDQTKVTEAAQNAGVTLNSNLSDIASLSPNDVSNKFAGIYTDEQKQTALTLQTTGLGTGDPAAAANAAPAVPPGGKYGDMLKRVEDESGLSAVAPGVLAKTMKIETGGNCNSVSPTGPAGCFQYSGTTWDKWSAAINNGVPLDRSLRYDPEVSARVTANYMATNWAKYGDLITQSGMDPAAALYTIHNIGDGGGPKFIAAYAQDPNMSVSQVLDANSIRYNPGLYGNGNITLAQAEQNMLSRMNGSTNFAGAAYTGSPFGGGAQTGWNYYSPNTPYGVSASPFGNVYTPVPASYPGAPVPTVSTGAPVSTGNPVSTGGTVSTGGVISTNGTVSNGVTTAPVPAAQPVASIIVQPASAIAGNPLTVSWSSFGMQPNNPCKILVVDASSSQSVLAQSNEGTKSITPAQSGKLTFSMQCLALNGASVQQATSASIR